MQPSDSELQIMKTLWAREKDGRWGISGLKALTLRSDRSKKNSESDFFKVDEQMALLTDRPRNFHAALASFGPANFLMKQSVLPVVALVDGEKFIRCIGTGFVISATGYVATACHVLLDPIERGYGKVQRLGNTVVFSDALHMGVLIPISPAYGVKGFRFFPFQQSAYWGEWRHSPLLHEPAQFATLADIAICKIAEFPNDVAHQPLMLSLNRFKVGEQAYALGYANMEDIPVTVTNGQISIPEVEWDLYMSVGEVFNVLPQNHIKKETSTPGPCFEFRAKIPGKMSGGPIFGAQGIVVRGVVSRSFSGERHAYGAMMGPIMHLPVKGKDTLKSLMESGNEGIAQIQGQDL